MKLHCTSGPHTPRSPAIQRKTCDQRLNERSDALNPWWFFKLGSEKTSNRNSFKQLYTSTFVTFSPKKLLTTGALEPKLSAPIPPSETFNEALRHGSRCGR